MNFKRGGYSAPFGANTEMGKRRKSLLLVLNLILAVALVGGIVLFERFSNKKEEASLSQEYLSRRYRETVAIDGQDFPLKRQMSSVLLIGTDNFVDDDKQNDLGFDIDFNYNLCDFLIVLVFDHANKTITPVQICRDSMCDVPWISVNGITDGTVYQQIAFAHTYGSGKEDSCVNTRSAVSNLLCGVPIGNYFAFTMDAVPVLNDLVGGVTVKLTDDIPALGPQYVRGAEVTLKGKDALRFVRYRDTELLDSNLTRMAHHRLYLDAFTAASRAALEENEDLVTQAFKTLEPFLCTDLSIENISDIARWVEEYEMLPAVTPDGEYVMGEEFAEFLVDEDSLRECVRKVFCD